MKITRPKSKQPIPASAKRVFKGEIFDVYQWPQKMYDGSMQTFEKIKRTDTVSIIPVTEDGKIILAKQQQPARKPYTGLIAGQLEPKERPLAGAKRELLEETGYSAKDWIFLDAVQPIGKIEWVAYYFIAKGCKKITNQNLDSGEKINLLYLDFDEFVKIVLEESDSNTLKIELLEAKLNPKKMRALKKLMG